MLSNFTFQQIEAFLTIAKLQSITKACEILYISQPALSKILKRFEDNFGTPLFVRNNHGVSLTAAGKHLYTQLMPIYNDLEIAFHSVKDMIGPEDRFLNISLPIMFDLCEDFNPVRNLIERFKKQYPSVRVIETVLDLKKLQNMLDIRFVDLVIAPEYSISPSKLVATKRICEVQQWITMSANHPLAQEDTLDFEQLNDIPFLSIPYQEALFSNNLLSMICRQNGFTPKSIECPPNYATAIHSAMNGNTMTVGPRNVDSSIQALKYYPLKTLEPPLYAVAAWSKNNLNRAAQLFLSMI